MHDYHKQWSHVQVIIMKPSGQCIWVHIHYKLLHCRIHDIANQVQIRFKMMTRESGGWRMGRGMQDGDREGDRERDAAFTAAYLGAHTLHALT